MSSCSETESQEESIVETIRRLAEMPTVEYERARKDEAKRLNMRTTVLDREVSALRKAGQTEDDLGLVEPDPWTEEVDGDDLLDRIVAGVRRHVVLPDHAAEAVALWCVHTFAFDIWQHTPRLAIGAPEKGCGKSLLLDVIACLVPRALLSDSLSEAVAFRLAESHKPVFLIDESDAHLAGKNPDDGLRGILNSGHGKGRRALRCVGDSAAITVHGFQTFTPVAMAGIGSLPPTLADRSARVTLQRRRPDEHVQDFRSDRADHLRDLASQAARWVKDNGATLRHADPAMPDGIFNRRADVWRPLLAIADVAGGSWPERARVATLTLEQAGAGDGESLDVLLLGDIRTAFDQYGEDRMSSAKLVEYLHDMEDRPWPEWKGGKPITPVQVARRLRRFGIAPGTIRTETGTPKGYKRSSFENLFDRYLPPVFSRHTPQPAGNCEKSEIRTATKGKDVAFQNGQKARDSAGCGGVAANGQGGQEIYHENASNDASGSGSRASEEGLAGPQSMAEDAGLRSTVGLRVPAGSQPVPLNERGERRRDAAAGGAGPTCLQCGDPVGIEEPSIPCDGRIIHERCHDAYFGFERQG